MNEDEVKKCPECGGEMEEGARLTFYGRWPIPQAVKLAKEGDFYGDKIIPFFCKKCGFIKLYKTPPHKPSSLYKNSHLRPPSASKNCVECGEEISINEKECGYCGAKQPEYEKP